MILMPNRYAIPLHDRFVPVPVRARRDGWTVARQRGFVRALGEGVTVAAAAARVGMSARSAYRLHDRPHAASFRKAWRTALALAAPPPVPRHELSTIKLHRWRGRIVHREVVWNEAAVARALRGRDPYAFVNRVPLDEALARLEAECAAAAVPAIVPCLVALRAKSYTDSEGGDDRCVNFATFRRRGQVGWRAEAGGACQQGP